MTLKEYYKKIYVLSFINRYTNIIRVRNEDVAQHAFFVAAIVMKLHDEYNFDLGKALQAAISHDMTEADLSDITHGVKKANPDLAKEIKVAERKSIMSFPQAVIDGFTDFEDESSIEGMIANLADVMQVQQYVESEISLGNSNMFKIDTETRIRMMRLREGLKPYVKT